MEHSHKFERDQTIAEKVPTLQGPAFDVAHQHKYPADGKLDIVEARPPKEQQYPVLDSDHKNVYTPQKEPDARPPKELTGPKFDIDRCVRARCANYNGAVEAGIKCTYCRKHQYTGMDMQLIDDELDKAKKISTDLVGPVYDCDVAMNHFKEVVMHAEAIRTLQGPVYDADRDHHFKALVVHAHELKQLQGPVYEADRNHAFQQLVTHAHELKTLMTPVYGGEKSQYVPEMKKAETDMPINAPVYKGVQDKNLYNPKVQREFKFKRCSSRSVKSLFYRARGPRLRSRCSAPSCPWSRPTSTSPWTRLRSTPERSWPDQPTGRLHLPTDAPK